MFDNYDTFVADPASNRLSNTSRNPVSVGEISISNMRIISPHNYSIAVDISKIFTQLSLTEDLFSPYIKGFVEIVDSFGLYEEMPIIGDEFFHFTFYSTGAGPEDTVDRYFRIIKVTDFNKHQDNDRVFVYKLHFVSMEYIFNLKTKVQKSYPSHLVHQIVEDIYDNYIKSSIDSFYPDSAYQKDIELEMTKGEHNIVIPNYSPFHAIEFLSERAESSEEVSSTGAMFSFYETLREGFKFKSLESLMLNDPSLTYVYAPENLPHDSFDEKFAFDSQRIKQFYRLSNIDMEDKLKRGTYANRMITHNMLRMKHETIDYYYKEPTLKHYAYDQSTGARIERDPIMLANDFNEYVNEGNNNYEDNIRKIVDDTHHFSNNAVISTASDVLGSPVSNISLMSSNFKCFAKFSDVEGKGKPQDRSIRETNIERWFQKRKSQFGLLNTFVYQVIVPGNTHRMVGDVVNLQIPTNFHDFQSTRQQNRLASGNFLVSSIEHRFLKSQQNISHNLAMVVMKDSMSGSLPEPIADLATQGDYDEDSVMGDE